MAILSWLGTKLGSYALKIIAGIVLVLGAYYMVKQSGRVAERMEGQAKALEAAHARRQIDRKVESLSDDDVTDLLLPPDRRKSKGRKRSS